MLFHGSIVYTAQSRAVDLCVQIGILFVLLEQIKGDDDDDEIKWLDCPSVRTKFLN